MLESDILSYGTDILLCGFAIYLFVFYFDIFFIRKQERRMQIAGCLLFTIWQLIISYINFMPAYVNISIACVVTFISVTVVYEGGCANKCIFSLAFNAIWMLIETLSGYILSMLLNELKYPQLYNILGSLISKIIFLLVILALKSVFTNEEIRELSIKYSVMFVLIPIGSIYIMNDIFLLGSRARDKLINIRSIAIAVILLVMNVLIFYIYIKLADDLRLRRMNSVYEQQLELCERHQQEREISMLQLRDARHNMKNNLVSILAYAENGECEKIIDFVNEVMDEGGITLSSISNSGNIVIDSLIGYWYVRAQKKKIDFSVKISIPMVMPFKGADLCLILGNLLENAVEAAQKAEKKKYIKIYLKYDKDNLLMFVANSYKGKLIKTKDKMLKSTKPDASNHGVGLSSVYRAVAKYQGTVMIEDSVPEQFCVRVLLYGIQE